jgi:hypothetical protein
LICYLQIKMPRLKEKRKIIHQPSTKEIFGCLSNGREWVKLLINESNTKPYVEFLNWMIDKKFYENEERVTIKKISKDYNERTSKITLWIEQIYEDIFQLNESDPQKFSKEGVIVNLQMSNYDNSCSLVLALPVVPREFEMVTFRFVHAKMGTDYFWVKNIQHEIYQDEVQITVWLEGGFVNKYREFAYEKAKFQEEIHWTEEHSMNSFEIDSLLRKLHRN